MKKIIYLSVIVAMLCSVDAFGSEYTSAEDDPFEAVDLGAPISVVNQSAISLDNPEQNLRYAVMSAPASESNSDDGESQPNAQNSTNSESQSVETQRKAMNLDEVGDNFWSDNIDKFETQNESPSAIGQITPPSTEPNPDVSKTQVQDYTDSEDQSNVSKKQEVSSMRSYDRSSELTIPNSRSDDSNLVILSSQLENVSSQLETTLTNVSLQLKDVSYTLGVLKDLMKAVQREMGTQQKNLN